MYGGTKRPEPRPERQRDGTDLIAEICGHGQEELVPAKAAHQRPQLTDLEELGLVRVEAAVELSHSAGPVLQLLLIPEAVVQQELDHFIAGVGVDVAGGLQGRQGVMQPGFFDPGHGSPLLLRRALRLAEWGCNPTQTPTGDTHGRFAATCN